MAGFLPYGGGGTGLWSGSFLVSVSTHALAGAGLFALYTTAPPPPPLEERTAFNVTIQELDTEALEGTVQEEFVPPDAEGTGDGGDAEEEVDTEEVAEPEEAPVPEEIPEEPELAEAEEAETPELEEVETAEADEVEPPEVEEIETTEVEELTVEPVEEIIPEEFQEAEIVEVPEAIGAVDGIVAENLIAVPIDEGQTALASTVVEAITPVAPPASPVAAEPELNPLAPIEETSPLAPEIAAPLEGAGGGAIDPVAPVATPLAAVSAAGPTSLVAVAPNLGEAAPITPVAPEAEQVASVTSAPSPTPAPSQSAPPAPPSAQDRQLGELIGGIRQTPSDNRCLVALPRRDGEEGVALSLISASEAAMEAYAQELLTAEQADIPQTRTLVDERQCAALNYIAATRDYPATRMGISADSVSVLSGDVFSGVLRGTSGRYLTLLIVDDNGVVQDLQRFTSFSANLARFEIPVNRDGAARDTKQILLAIATTRPPTEIRDRIGRLAQEVFGGLPEALASDAAIGVLTFDVRVE